MPVLDMISSFDLPDGGELTLVGIQPKLGFKVKSQILLLRR